MRKLGFSPLLLVPAVFSMSCASTPPPEEKPVVSATATATASAAAPALDLSPVAAPQNIVLQLHTKNLSAPFDMVGVRADAALHNLLGQGLGKKGLKLDVDPDKVAALVATEAPVDAVISLSDQSDPFIAFAIGLHGLDDARTAFNVTAEVEPGMWSLPGSNAHGMCVVAASTGLVNARLICGPGERDIKALGPYLARGTSSLPTLSDATLDIDVGPINSKFGGDLRRMVPLAPRFVRNQFGIGEPQFDKALETAASALADEGVAFLSDLDKLHVETTLSGQTGAKLDTTLTFKNKSSWIARTAAKSKNAPVPAMFFRVPIDSSSVTASLFRDPSDYDGMKRVGKDAVEGLLAKFKIGSEAERKKVSSLLDFPLTKDMTFVSASGFAHVTKVAEPKTDNDKFNAFMDAQSGWRLFGTNAKAEVVSKWLKDAAAAYNQPGIQNAVQAQQKAGEPLPNVKTPPPPAKLGKGAFEVDIEMKMAPEKDKKGAAPATTMILLVMADGDDSWVAFGLNRDELVERLLSVKTGAPKDKQLESRADVAAMKNANDVSIGFISLDSFRGLAASFLMMRAGDMGGKAPFDGMWAASKKMDEFIAGLPNKASTPMTFETVQVTSEPLVGKFTFTVPKGSITDAMKLAEFAAR